jgi:hypothetical protein
MIEAFVVSEVEVDEMNATLTEMQLTLGRAVARLVVDRDPELLEDLRHIRERLRFWDGKGGVYGER